MLSYRPFVLVFSRGRWDIKNVSYWEYLLSSRNSNSMAVLVENQQDEKAFELWKPAAAAMIALALKRGYGVLPG